MPFDTVSNEKEELNNCFSEFQIEDNCDNNEYSYENEQNFPLEASETFQQ